MFELKPQDVAASRELARACGIAPVTAQVMLHRGIAGIDDAKDWLAPKLAGLTKPDSMADRELAVDRIAHAVRHKERIVVFGDYDVDGTTSAALLSLVLEALGGDVKVLAANRFEGGYGFSEPALAKCIDAGARLIVTCDCGSSDHPRIAAARQRGIDVVVVDHHLVPKEALPANAFLNPHRPDCGFPYKGMSSAGLVFVVAAGLRAKLGAQMDLRPYLDLVALGTIADVAPLDGDNRRLVRAGLGVLAGSVRPGIAALRDRAELRPGPIGAIDVAFRLAPRLNASGRMGDPALTVALLRAQTHEEARRLADDIERINEERRAVERRNTEEACAQVIEVYGVDPKSGVVVASEGWHRGVVGICAARLVDRFRVPAIVIAVENGVGHGSCRTPEGVDLYAAVAKCKDDLLAFGGHRAAAGVTLRSERLEAFRAGFADATRRGEETKKKGFAVDAAIDGQSYALPSARELMLLEPVGEANREPLFALTGARVERTSCVGDGGHLKLRLLLGNTPVSAFGFELGRRAEGMPERIDAIGHLRPDTFNGGGAIELRLLDFARA